jgi:hypothetical protein
VAGFRHAIGQMRELAPEVLAPGNGPVLLEGQITSILDDSEVTLHAGDFVVQRGTDHAWANRGDTTAKVVFVLIDGEFDTCLAATLPGGLAGLMHGGPRD